MTMHGTKMEGDCPVSPGGRLFVQPELTQIIHCIFGCENPINVEAFKSGILESEIVKHPRFCSLMVKDTHWRRTKIKIDQHVIVHEDPVGDDHCSNDEDAINSYVADLSVSSPLSAEKPLWELHLLRAHQCAIFRFHHALGDGISLMSLLLSCCRRVDDPNQRPVIDSMRRRPPPRSSSQWSMKNFLAELWRLIKAVFLTAVFGVELLSRLLWKSDPKTAMSGCDGVELWPRKIATAKFTLEDMKAVKKAVPESTINDVLFGVISSGLSRYLELHSPEALGKGLQITGVGMVNMRKRAGVQDLSYMMEDKSRARWGNKIGAILLPVYCFNRKDDANNPLLYVNRAKEMMDRKKLSFEAHLTYKFSLSWFGPKIGSWLSRRILHQTTFYFSNVIGPQQKITMFGNNLTYIRVNNSSLPNALTLQMVSYAGRADMQILAAKDIIPDPKILAKCFEDSLFDMKEAAIKGTNN